MAEAAAECSGPGKLNRARDGHIFDELMLLYLKGPSREKKSRERDRFSRERLFPAFTGNVLKVIGVADVAAYVGRRWKDGAAPGTINNGLGVLSAGLNRARREPGWNVPDPAQGRGLREPSGRTRWLTRNEAGAMRLATDGKSRRFHVQVSR